MGQRQNRTAKLKMKKETLRALQNLDDEQLRQVGGAMAAPRIPTVAGCLPSCNGC